MSFSFTSNVTQYNEQYNDQYLRVDKEIQRKRKRFIDRPLIKTSDKRVREDNEKTLLLEMEISKLLRLQPVPHEVCKFPSVVKTEIKRYLTVLIGENYNDNMYHYNLECLKKYLITQGFKKS